MRQFGGLMGLKILVLASMLAACGGGGGSKETPNRTPVSNAGNDQSVSKGTAVTLDGSGSSDADGNALSYRWTQTGGATVSLSSGTASRPTFNAPPISGTLTFSLIVNDGKADSAADTVQIAVTNRAPVANAGADASIEAGQLFTLDALGSTDADQDALTYTWTQLSGPAVTLTAVSNGRARFTAPAQISRLTFGVVANDGEAGSSQDVVALDVVISSVNAPPVAYGPGNFTLPKRTQGFLQGYGVDPEGGPITYRWRQVGGPTVTLSNASSWLASFESPAAPAVLTFEFNVSDGVSVSETIPVVVTVENVAPSILVNALTPQNPRTLDDIVLDAQAYDADTDPLTVTYAWTRNGTAVPAVTGAVFPASETTRGDVIAVTVTANDGTMSTSVDATTTIEDTPPTLSAAAPTVVNFGDTVSFQVSASADVDGDPAGDYVVRLGPAGFGVSSGGAATWLAEPAMFDDHVDVAWSIGLRDAPTAGLSGTIRVNHAARLAPIMRAGITVQQNRDDIVVADLDLDGVGDILVTDGRALSIVDRAGAEYLEKWSYPFSLSDSQSGITAIAAANVAGDARPEIFVAAGKVIRQLAGGTYKQTAQYEDTQIASCNSLRVADLDNDGHAELVCLAFDAQYSNGGASSIVVLDAQTLTLEARINQTGLGSSLAVGNVDADAALEIVAAGGFVYDGASLANQWAYGPQFGTVVDTGDINGDGVQEIVATATVSGVAIRAFDAVTRAVRADIPAPGCCGYSADIRLADLDGDNRAEVLAGSNGPDGVTIWKFDTGTQTFSSVASLASQDYEVTGLAIGNVDGDSNPEIIWGTGIAHSGQDILVVSQFAAPTTLSLEWKSTSPGQLDGPFYGGQLARTGAASSRVTFVSQSTASGYGGPRLLLIDPVTGGTTISGPLNSTYNATSAIEVADTDADALDEVLFSTIASYPNWNYSSYDLASATTEWSSPSAFASALAMAHADFTGDGRAELVSLGSDGRVTVFDVAQSTVVWQSIALGGGNSDIAVADLDHDGQPEIVVLGSQTLYVFGRASTSGPFEGRAAVTVVPPPYYYNGAGDLLVADTDGDGEEEIFVAQQNTVSYPTTQEVKVFDRNLAPLRTLTLTKRITNLALEPAAGPRKNLLISTANDNGYYWAPAPTEIWAIDAVTGAGVWRSPGLPGEFSRNSLQALDVNGDGRYELSFGTSVGAFLTR
jgi:hypothetical protein